MDSILREKLLNNVQGLTLVSAIYRNESSRFVDAYLQWIENAEQDLSGLRSSFSVLLQSEKSKVISVMDGYMPDYINEKRSIRRNQKAVAAQSLSFISQAIYAKIEYLNKEFNDTEEKICHALAVLANRNPDIFNLPIATELGVTKIWEELQKHSDTLSMYNYLSAKLTLVDRKYLFINIIQNMIDNSPSDKKKSTHPNNTPEKTTEKTGPLETKLKTLLEIFSKLNLENNCFIGLIDLASNSKKRKALAKKTNVDELNILTLVKCADLQRVTGITFPLAYILLLSGIDSVVELALRNPDNLLKKIVSVIAKSNFEINAPERKIIEDWIDEAHKLPRRLEF